MSLMGRVLKMSTQWATPINYFLHLGETTVPINTFLGKKIQLQFTGEIRCIQCDRKISKSFQQGYCFPCFKRLTECNLCIVHPEKCRFYEGNCQPDDWAHAHCGQAHIVYLANSSGLKVGITRASQIPTRWIDQGATQGLAIMQVNNRYQSGLIEVALKQYVADKTNWRTMLKSEQELQDLVTVRDELLAKAKPELDEIMARFPGEITLLSAPEVTRMHYPVLAYPEKITAINFDKTPKIEGSLLGLKGQYLILDTGVISMRKFAGYCLQYQ